MTTKLTAPSVTGIRPAPPSVEKQAYDADQHEQPHHEGLQMRVDVELTGPETQNGGEVQEYRLGEAESEGQRGARIGEHAEG